MLKFILPKFNFNVERWKWNKEYRVYVSTMGHFKDEYKQPISIKINKTGYVMIKTHAGVKSAHRLVMLTWLPIPNAEDLTVDHLDHNKRNNSLKNLEWVTHKENQKRAADDYISMEEIKIEPSKTLKLCVYLDSKNKIYFENCESAAAWLVTQKKYINNNDKKELSPIELAAKIHRKASCGRTYFYKWSYVFV